MVHSYPDRGIPQVDNVEMEFDYIKTHENELIKNCYPEEDHISEESEEEYDLDFDVLSDILQPSDTADPLQSTNDSEDMNDFDSDPLYPGASVTLGAFMLLLAVFTSRYNLIGEATEQLLKIIALALPHGHKLCSSLYEFKLFFKNLRNPLVRHYYCNHCLGYVENTSVSNCPYEFCGATFSGKNSCYFIEMPLENQVKNLFAQNGFYNSLGHRFNKTKSTRNSYEDIYDGHLYKNYVRIMESSVFKKISHLRLILMGHQFSKVAKHLFGLFI